MTNEAKEENLQKTSSEELASQKDSPMVEETSRVEDDKVIELTDDREYPNQLNMLRDIAHIYQYLTPSNKKIVRLSIARTA